MSFFCFFYLLHDIIVLVIKVYIENIDKRVKEYFKVLEPDFPLWLNDYIETPELLKQQYISVTCGTIYSDLFESHFFYSSLDHSIAVALIIWHFTHDKKQTLAGLFHDIATPVFKHCVDFLHGDYMSQESTEDLTSRIISGSKEIMNLLKRDNIDLSEVDDYHKYSIADNDTPMLSSDRLEYSLSNALFTYELLRLDEIKKIYEDIEIVNNESGNLEMSFKTKDIAIKFVEVTSLLSVIYREDRTRYSMQFLADVVKRLCEDNLLTIDDLYNLKESNVIGIIECSKYKDIYDVWKNSKVVKTSDERPNNVYYVHHGAKIRYIIPLVNGIRITEVSNAAKDMIDKNLSYNMDKYVYLDFNFE